MLTRIVPDPGRASSSPSLSLSLSPSRSPRSASSTGSQMRTRSFRRAQYSVDKFLAFEAYRKSTPWWCAAWVLVSTPATGLLAATLPSLVPLQDPLAGARANPGFFLHAFIIITLINLGSIEHTAAAVTVPTQLYSVRQALAISMLSAAFELVIVAPLWFAWRFPLPMSWVIGSALWGLAAAPAHLIVFRRRLWTDASFKLAAQQYGAAMLVQCTQALLYPAFSVLFDHVGARYQAALTVCFPVLKFALRRCLLRFTQQLGECHTEVAVSGVEICASLYQSMIMQNAPSELAVGIIMALDVIQGLCAIKFFMDRRTSVKCRHVVPEALKLIQACKSSRRGDPAVVVEALKLLGEAEHILLVEYYEVAIPIVNAIFLVVSCAFASAQYNPKLRHLHTDPTALRRAVESIVLYSALQALSLVAMHVVMARRYGLSALQQLAFTLQRHRRSIEGKMLAWLPIILHFTVVHYGVDFAFRFDFAAQLRPLESGQNARTGLADPQL